MSAAFDPEDFDRQGDEAERLRSSARPVANDAEQAPPPHDLDAEAAVLSAVMLDASALDKVTEFLRPEHFYSEAHRRIFEAGRALADEGKPVDVVQVATWLREHERLVQVGGMAYLTEILNAAPAVMNVASYGETVFECWRKRQRLILAKRLESNVRLGRDTQADAAELSALCAPLRTLPAVELPTLAALVPPALARAERRAAGAEKPVPLPWPNIAAHFGGGLWQGVHFVTANTGVGKTALVLGAGLHAAKNGVPVAYVGLELDELQVGLWLAGEAAGVPWSALYLGKAGDVYLERTRAVVPLLSTLPFHPFIQRPQGWSASALVTMAEAMRARYPAEASTVRRPLLFVVDYLQLVGDEADARGRPMNLDARSRVGAVAYALRDIAIRFDAAVLVISSVAREKYGLFDACTAAKLDCDEDDAGRPINRRVLNPDAVVGLGKESGEIEYAADSVSVLAKVPGTWKDGATDVLFVTAKGRATGPTWSPLHFTRWGYREADDGGSFTWEAMRASEHAREAKRAEQAEARERAKGDKLDADARLVAAYVMVNPRCSVRQARACAVNNNPRRWAPAVARLGAALVHTAGVKGKSGALSVDPTQLKPEHGT